MAINSGENVSTSYEGLGYAYDKVFFQADKPILNDELNSAQEFQEILTRKSTAHLPSGWLSYRPVYTHNDLDNCFYTQDPEGSKPEVALVNGWPIYVTNTNTPLRHINKIQFNDSVLRSGSRVDGVFLEVWRSQLSPEENTENVESSTAKPQPISKVSTLYGIYMYNENIGWAVGDNGTILKTTDSGTNWISVNTPINVNFKKVKFYNLLIGYAVADGGVIIKSNDGGESWFNIETPVTDNLNDIFIINDQNICAVGDNGTILLSIDGLNFDTVTHTSSVTKNINSVYFYDVSVGWATGESGTLLMTTNGGNIWHKYNMNIPSQGITIEENINSISFYNLNDGLVVTESGNIYRTSDSGYSWASMSNRIWNSGEYKSLSDIFPGDTIDLTQVFTKKEYAIKFTIAVYSSSRNYFKNLIYKISPDNYPNSLVLEYTGVQDNINYLNVLDLDLYANSEELRDAINDIMSPYKSSDASLPDDQREKIRVFEASIDYESFGVPSDFRPTSGSFSSLSPAQISFSVEDKAWIVGDNGVLLYSSNSGAKWELVDLGVGVDFKDFYYISNTKQWACGTEGYIVKYNPEGSSISEVQTTDLRTRVNGRIYPEGNILSEADNFLFDDMINPQVGVETSKRIQIQYRIRIADGIDPDTYPESGLGHNFIYSLGPNDNSDDSGGYIFTNMGDENGDYGLWRARCRNTYDGYSWAIPMFFVTRRNSSAFDVNTNINGSTNYDIGSIRPDGLTYEDIIGDDIVDIRRMINIQSYSHLLEKNLEDILTNQHRTVISDREHQGIQYGSTIFMADQYDTETDLDSLITGGISSSAVIVSDQKVVDPNIQITEADLTFGPINIGLYHNDPSYYSAYVKIDGELTTETVEGVFEGFGTNKVIFHIDENFSPAGGDLEGVEYVVTVHYMDYSKEGLSRVPQDPIAVKYQSNPIDPSTSLYSNAINSRIPKKVYETLSSDVTGYNDFVEIFSAINISDNIDDTTLYEIVGHEDHDSLDYKRGVNKYKNQQYKGSFVNYHYYMHITETTNIIKIPKNLNGYSIFGVKEVKNINGSVYKIGIDYLNNMTMRDEDNDGNENIIVYLDPAFTIPYNSIIEVVLDVFVTSGDIDYPEPPTSSEIGITVSNRGESQQSLRTSFTSNYNLASRSVSGMYAGVLFPLNAGETVIDLTTQTESSGLRNAVILGIGSFDARDNSLQQYAWYKQETGNYYSIAPISSIRGFGTTSITITFDDRKTQTTGTLLIPLLVKMNNFPTQGSTSEAISFYKYMPYQTIGNLPDTLKVEVLKCSDFIYVTNLGTGASDLIRGEPYVVPAEQISVNSDDVFNDNFFSNLDDMDFANFRIDTGFVKLPAIISQYVNQDLIFSNPNNIGDKLGRKFYQACSSDIIYNCEDLTISTPRKVFIPFLARIRTKMTTPFLRGEIVLVIMNKTYRARNENKTGYYEDMNVEYIPGYFEEADTSISLYKLINKPLVRK